MAADVAEDTLTWEARQRRSASIAAATAALVPFTPGGAGVAQALLVKVFAGTAAGATVAAYSVGQQIAIGATTFACGFAALVWIFRFRSFREVIAAGREAKRAPAEPRAPA